MNQTLFTTLKQLYTIRKVPIGDYARKGGHVVVTGESGLWDEHGAQRFENPLRAALAGI